MLKKQTSPGCPEHWSGPHTGRTGNAPRKQTKYNIFVFSEGKKKILTLYWTFWFLVSEQTKSNFLFLVSEQKNSNFYWTFWFLVSEQKIV